MTICDIQKLKQDEALETILIAARVIEKASAHLDCVDVSECYHNLDYQCRDAYYHADRLREIVWEIKNGFLRFN